MPPKSVASSSSSKLAQSSTSKPTTSKSKDALPSHEDYNGNIPIELLTTFHMIGENSKSYKHQYANVYFMRLATLKPIVRANAERIWADVPDNPVYVPRVLDVVKGQLCFIIGTVYMDMPLKPNVLADIEKEHWVAAPPPRSKYISPTLDTTLLEDDSGRIKLVGSKFTELKELGGLNLVTGVIMAALGVETSAGEFEVVDVCFAGMAGGAAIKKDKGKETKVGKKDEEMDVDEPFTSKRPWIALLSGLELSSFPDPSPTTTSSSSTTTPSTPAMSASTDIALELLIEFLKGESGGPEDQKMSREIGALIVLGNSLDVPRRSADDARSSKRYNHQPTYDPTPLRTLTSSLKDIASSMPVHLLPGALDPAGATLPQQPIPRAMFGFETMRNGARGGVGGLNGGLNGGGKSGVFNCETNPAWIDVGGDGLLATSGQNLDDVYKYLASEDRLGMARDMLRWRHVAPTCPDTLWCYPFFDTDPFLLKHSPGIYAIGNQPAFASDLVISESTNVNGDRNSGGGGAGAQEEFEEQEEADLGAGAGLGLGLESGANARTRVVLVPRFCKTGEVVLVNCETLAVKVMRFGLGSRGWGNHS